MTIIPKTDISTVFINAKCMKLRNTKQLKEAFLNKNYYSITNTSKKINTVNRLNFR